MFKIELDDEMIYDPIDEHNKAQQNINNLLIPKDAKLPEPDKSNIVNMNGMMFSNMVTPDNVNTLTDKQFQDLFKSGEVERLLEMTQNITSDDEAKELLVIFSNKNFAKNLQSFISKMVGRYTQMEIRKYGIPLIRYIDNYNPITKDNRSSYKIMINIFTNSTIKIIRTYIDDDAIAKRIGIIKYAYESYTTAMTQATCLALKDYNKPIVGNPEEFMLTVCTNITDWASAIINTFGMAQNPSNIDIQLKQTLISLYLTLDNAHIVESLYKLISIYNINRNCITLLFAPFYTQGLSEETKMRITSVLSALDNRLNTMTLNMQQFIG